MVILAIFLIIMANIAMLRFLLHLWKMCALMSVMTTLMMIAISRILTTAKSWSAGLGLKRRGDVCVPRPPQTGHERPERAGEPDEVGGGIVLYLKLTYMYYCDLFDYLQTLQTIIDLSIKIADRPESDNLLKGNESEPSPRNQKHVKRTCAGHQVKI